MGMMRRGGLALLVIASSGWAASVACAVPEDRATEPQDITSLEEVIVTAKRIPGLSINPRELPAGVSVVTGQELARSGARTTTDVLQQLVGVSVMDSRGLGLGADGTVNLRGIVNSSRTGALVLVDGIRQNRITGDEVHWPAIPISQIERIEVLRGGGGTIYGEGALAGVINIVTKRGADKPLVAEQSLEGGSYGWWRGVTTARGTEGPLAYGLTFTRQLWDGYRDSTSTRGSSVNLVTTWTPWANTALDITANHHDDTSHFAGGLTPTQVKQDRRNRGNFPGFFHDRMTAVGTTLTQRLGDDWTVVGNLAFRRWDSDSTTTSVFENRAPSLTSGVRVAHHVAFPHWESTAVVGTDLARDKATTGTKTATLSESNKFSAAGFVEETLKLFARWVLTAGYRYDHSDYHEALTFPTFEGKLRFGGRSPKVGLTYLLNDRASLYTSWTQSFKAPNIDDLDAVLPPYNDNVGVRPQTARTTEAGARWAAAPWARLEGSLFHTRIRDEILFNNDTFANANFSTRRTGVELAARGALWRDRLSYGATYAFVRARFVKGAFTGYVIPGTPEHRVTLQAAYRFTPWLEGSADYLWVDTQFRINNFTNTLPGAAYGVTNATLRYRRPSHEVFLTVQNLLDKQYSSFQSSNGTAISTGENPAPPRTWLLGAKFTR